MRYLRLLSAVLFLLPAARPASLPEASAMKSFIMDWRDNAGALVDVSFLAEAPAGKNGFVTVKDGHLAAGNGARIRFWGINFAMMSGMPPHADAPAIAAYLSRLGINCVRFHHLDWLQPRGFIDASRNDTSRIVPELLDRLDFFIAELKKRGIYSDLNLNVGRIYKEGDGVRDYDKLGFAKALTYFDERLLELQRQYARQLLTHFNPYTKSEYRNEPAIAIVEMVNENSLVEAWLAKRLLGRRTTPTEGIVTWTDIPPSYERELTAKFQAWLKKQGKAEAPRLEPDEFASAPAERFRDEVRFYMQTEEAFFRGMRSYLRDRLGVKSLLVGTSDHNQGISGYPLLHSTSQLDIVDGHAYWQHPGVIRDPVTGKTWQGIRNTPMLDEPLASIVVRLSRSAVAGKPYIVTEVNHPFPAEHACEGIPVLAAYAAFQDWDGVFWYNFEHAVSTEWEPRVRGSFEMRADPVRMTALPAGALLFARADVSPARQTVGRSYSLTDVYESLRTPRSLSPFFLPGFPPATPLRHGTRIASLEGVTTRDLLPAGEAPYVSDTRELAWSRGQLTVETPRSEAVIGRQGDRAVSLAHLSIRTDTPFRAIVLSSLDGRPLAKASRMLLSATARSANTGMKWNESRTALVERGSAPTVIEPVQGELRLRGLEGARVVEAMALNGGGHAAGKAIPARKSGGEWLLELGEPATTWYLVTVRRQEPGRVYSEAATRKP